MPELPEVETIKRGLDSTIIGQKIVGVEILLPKMFVGDKDFLIGSTVTNISRKGKLLVIDVERESKEERQKTKETVILSETKDLKLHEGDSSQALLSQTVQNDNYFSILIHLKMTGQLIFKSQTLTEFAGGHPIPPLNTPLPNKSTKVIFNFESGDLLYFNDLRTFGYVKVIPTDEVKDQAFVKALGVEPFSDKFTVQKFKDLIEKRSKMNIKAFLLDQRYVAGLGNIYTDETLFFSGVLPTRSVGSLNELETALMFQSILDVLNKGIDTQGASKTSYVNLAGKKGTFMSNVAVYQRAGEPCIKCGRPIEKIKHVGRGTHFCSFCQR
jgi:DNA-formamidopyrimidine glycosylase